MQHKIVETSDGSPTVFSEKFGEQYHSLNGALTESLHVFIDKGFNASEKTNLKVLEIGMGTALNVYLTFHEALRQSKSVFYETIEKYPLPIEIINHLLVALSKGFEPEYLRLIHELPWEKENKMNEYFTLQKLQTDLLDYTSNKQFDVIYFDAFSPQRQPEMWSQEIFNKLFALTADEGKLVTYCAQGEVRRSMQRAGYICERLPGPPGKREMLRASKPYSNQQP
jgi:tRNA U34 5-methylaminomethyl-2-thiouridine-forming methyltransferase MnmC